MPMRYTQNDSLIHDVRRRLVNLGYPAERLNDEQLVRMAGHIQETIGRLGPSTQQLCKALESLANSVQPRV